MQDASFRVQRAVSRLAIRNYNRDPAMKLRTLLTATVVAGAFHASAYAAPITFFGEDRGVFNQDGVQIGVYPNSTGARDAFFSNLVGVGTELFEGYDDATGAPLALVFPGAGTATLTGGGSVDNDPGTGQAPISGDNWWRTGAGNNFVINFSAPVAAFGFFGIDIGDIGAQLTLTLSGGSSVVINIPHTLEPGGPSSGQNGSVIYFGYIDV